MRILVFLTIGVITGYIGFANEGLLPWVLFCIVSGVCFGQAIAELMIGKHNG